MDKKPAQTALSFLQQYWWLVLAWLVLGLALGLLVP